MIMKRTIASATDKKSDEVHGIDNMFALYANPSTGVIDPVGMDMLWTDLSPERTGITMLLLAWKLKARRWGHFTRDEWRAGMKSLKADTLRKLQKRLPGLEQEVASKENFKHFYSYTFCHHLTNINHRTLDIQTACTLLEVVLGPRFKPQVTAFIKYLKMLKEHQLISVETWIDFYHFCHKIDFPGLSNYHEHNTWDIVIDTFIDALR